MSKETNHESLDQGPSTPDWENQFPLGITTPMACRIIETWLNTEHVSVIQTLVQHRSQSSSAVCSLHASPPNARRGWQIQYRGVDYEQGEFMPFPDQLDRLKTPDFDLRSN